MKFTLSWLKDHLETSASLQEITERLTKVGLEVESVVNPAENLAGFKVGHILEAKPHPEADRLQVCLVECGESAPRQIVCGAPNARQGLKVVLGLPGTYVPGLDVTLKVTKIRGVESLGMLCSGKELGIGNDHESGILELDEAAPVGMDFATVAGLDDPVIEIAVTPNRPDCLGVRGVARDLAATGVGVLKPLETPQVKGDVSSSIKLSRDAKAERACLHYLGRVINGVTNKPSPLWLQRRLEAVGLKPISALVDITNYISFDLCRPLHVFDTRAIQGNEVRIRLAERDELFMALDQKEYSLSESMLVIADHQKALAIGGVMGGLESGCTLETTDVFLESAYFSPSSIAETGRKLYLHSDARYRFERGIDPLSARVGLEKATQMILDLCGGTPSDVVEVGASPFMPTHIPFSVDLVARHTGMNVSDKQASSILEALGFSYENGIALPPSWRPDVSQSIDVVEEVGRIYGYEHLPEMPLPEIYSDSLESRFYDSQVRHLLASRGLMEVVTWSMVSQKEFELFGGTGEEFRIINPITIDLEYLRPSVLVHLVKVVQQNLDRGMTPLSFFEIGPRYRNPSIPGDFFFLQEECVAGVKVGKEKAYHWSKQERSWDVFDIKADMMAILDTFNFKRESVEFVTEDLPSWYHPGRSAWVRIRGTKLENTNIGIFGELHPLLLKELGIKERVVAFEMDLCWSSFGKNKPKGPLFLSPFQKIERDFCFLFNKNVKASHILETIRKVDPCIKEVQVFDLYEGQGVSDGMKSVSIHVTFEPMDHTFSDVEIKALYDKVVNTVESNLKGSLRL